MHGNMRGPLHGIPFALKDIYDTAGILTSGHSRTCIDRVPDKDATTVARLRAAGARADGQARDARVRARRSVVRPAVAAGAQSLEHGAFHRRLVVGLGRRGRCRPRAGEPRLRHRRLDPRPGWPVRYRRTQAHLRPRQPRRRVAELLLLRSLRTHGAHVAGLRPAAERDRRPRSEPTRLRPRGRSRISPKASMRGIKGLRIGVVRHFWEKDLQRQRRAVSRARASARRSCARLGLAREDVTMRPLQTYSDVKIVMAETELFSLHLPELIARAGAFGQDFRARSLAACLFTAEDYVRASRERRAMIEEMQPLYRRFDLLVTANGSTSAAARRARSTGLLAAAELHLALQLHRRPGAGTAVRLFERRLAAVPADRRPAAPGCPRPACGLCLRAWRQAFYRHPPDIKPGATPAELDPKPWRPDTSQVEPAVRAFAENAATRAGLRLAAEHHGGAGRSCPVGDGDGQAPAPGPRSLG